MQEISIIKTNIKKYLVEIGLTKYKFYKETGITRGILDQNNGISEENTTKFLAYFPKVNIEWLITGEGEMFKSDESHTPQIVNEPDTPYGVNWRDKYNQLLGEVELLRELQGLGKRGTRANGTSG